MSDYQSTAEIFKFKDERIGKLGEADVRRILRYYRVVVVDSTAGNFPEFDEMVLVKVPGKKTRIRYLETKTDTTFYSSLNIFVETHETRSNGEWKPSGINSTKADLYVVYMPKWRKVFFARTKRLREVLKKHHFRQVTGNKDRTHGVLIPEDEWIGLSLGAGVVTPEMLAFSTETLVCGDPIRHPEKGEKTDSMLVYTDVAEMRSDVQGKTEELLEQAQKNLYVSPWEAEGVTEVEWWRRWREANPEAVEKMWQTPWGQYVKRQLDAYLLSLEMPYGAQLYENT